jgi:integrase
MWVEQMRKRLSPRTIRALKPGKGGVRHGDVVLDDITPNFGVRVLGTPEKPTYSFVLVTRFPGATNPTRAAIAPFVFDRSDEGVAAESLRKARSKARHWVAMIEEGRDPRIEEARQREVQIRTQATTFGAVAEDFIRDKLPGERRGAHVEREIKNEFKSWWNRPASEITDEDVIRIVRAKAKTAPASARNILGHAKRLFQWAIDQRTYGLKASPTATIKPDAIVGKKIARNHILGDDDLFAFWRATSRMPYPAAPVYRMLLLTGLRLNEAAEASWNEFHPTVVRAIRQRGDEPIDWTQFNPQHLSWTIPAGRMKGQNDSARAHVVPLTIDILRILETLPMFAGGDFLFSHSAGRTPAIMSSEVKDALDAHMLRTLRALARKRGDNPAAVALEWINHDLRRNVRSGLSRLKIAEEVREAVLAHVRPGVKGVYDQHDYFDEKRDALIQWGARLRGIVEPTPTTSNVVALRG